MKYISALVCKCMGFENMSIKKNKAFAMGAKNAANAVAEAVIDRRDRNMMNR